MSSMRCVASSDSQFIASSFHVYDSRMTPGLSGPSSSRYVARLRRSVSVIDMTSWPVFGSLSFQNGRSTMTNVFELCM